MPGAAGGYRWFLANPFGARREGNANASAKPPVALIERGREDSLDAARYRRLQVLGCAPYGSKQLDQASVLRFSGLDAFVDEDLRVTPSRGEALSPLHAGNMDKPSLAKTSPPPSTTVEAGMRSENWRAASGVWCHEILWATWWLTASTQRRSRLRFWKAARQALLQAGKERR